MDCHDVLLVLLDYQQGRLAPEAHRHVRAHLDGCASCAHEDRLEHELTQALERRLPQYSAPLAFKRRLAAQWPTEPSSSEPQRSPLKKTIWLRSWMPAAAAAAILLVLAPFAWQRLLGPAGISPKAMVTEARTHVMGLNVADKLRTGDMKMSTLSRRRAMSSGTGSRGVTVSSPPVTGLCRSRR